MLSYSIKNRNTFYSLSKIFVILCAFLLLLTPSASARDYSLDSATANITVSSEGIVHVEESISYSFDGTYSEVYRQIYPPDGGQIRSIKGYCNGDASAFSFKTIAGGYELIGELPEPTPEKVDFVVSYDYYGGTKVYNDISELHFKLWGEDWAKTLNGFTATITLPTDTGDEVYYWVHPDHYTQISHLENNVIYIEADKIPARSWYEIRAVFPRIESPDPNYVSIQNEDGLDEILDIEEEYSSKQKLVDLIFKISILFACLVVIFPVIIYFIYGRESEIDYNAIYEREPPTDSKPAIVNALLRGSVGIPDMDGFTGTIMDLVNRNYIDLRDTVTEGSGLFKSEKEDVLIMITGEGNPDELLDFELDAYNLLKKHAPSGTVSWNQLTKNLSKGTEFYNFINAWNLKVSKQVKMDKMFISKGNNLIYIFSIVILIIEYVAYKLLSGNFPIDQFPVVTNIKSIFIAIAAFAIVISVFATVKQRSFGKWTMEGRLFQKRWDNFRKYLTDYSALEEHPPESIKIWDFYMVYAVTLGVAEKVIENMSLIVPSEQFRGSRFHSMHHRPMLHHGFKSAFNASRPNKSSGGSHGGVSGAGGGFGGGGGGAR